MYKQLRNKADRDLAASSPTMDLEKKTSLKILPSSYFNIPATKFKCKKGNNSGGNKLSKIQSSACLAIISN